MAAVCGRNGAQYQYRLMWDGQGREGGPFLLGLKPIEELRREAELLGIGAEIAPNLAGPETDLAGQKADLAAPS